MPILSTTSRRNPPDADLPEVLAFMQLLWAVVNGLEKVSKRMAGALGVTGPQRLALRVVGLFPGVSAGRLAAILHVHPSTLTGVLQRLVAQRLLRRISDPRDRRRAILRLTARGARVNAARDGTVEAAVASTLKSMRPRDRKATQRVLQQLARDLNRNRRVDRTRRRGSGGPSRSRQGDRI
jgi:DNA-binding MarR family transcriptional regulator